MAAALREELGASSSAAATWKSEGAHRAAHFLADHRRDGHRPGEAVGEPAGDEPDEPGAQASSGRGAGRSRHRPRPAPARPSTRLRHVAATLADRLELARPWRARAGSSSSISDGELGDPSGRVDARHDPVARSRADGWAGTSHPARGAPAARRARSSRAPRARGARSRGSRRSWAPGRRPCRSPPSPPGRRAAVAGQ